MTAEHGLDHWLPRMPAYWQRARELAVALAQLDGVDVVPAVPQTPLFHVHLHVPRAALDQAHSAHVDEGGLHLYLYSRSTSNPAWSRFELTVGEQAMEIDVTDVRTGCVTRAAPRPLAHHLSKSRNRHDPQRQAPYRLQAALAKGSQH